MEPVDAADRAADSGAASFAPATMADRASSADEALQSSHVEEAWS